ncbi:hypothetical protein [Ferrovibrio terrae]|uniref:hypothetical protein n=1 Tax=Ferrovibrio terrae TaxID=2594003 RepID=UPI0031377D78
MGETIFALTPVSLPYPPYINVSERAGGLEITIRSAANGEQSGATAAFHFDAKSRAELERLSAALQAYLAR